MGARFAGSQRLGDRRRRRLAVETDDVTGDDRQTVLSAPSGRSRGIDRPHADPDPAQSPFPFALAVSQIVPRQSWKYLLGGLACLAASGFLLIAGWYAADLSTAAGSGIERLFAFPEAPVAKWFSSMLLAVSAQLALLIWWARSQSDKDFDGRYWLWIRVSGTWLVLSGCVVTGAHDAWRQSLLHFWPDLSNGMATLGWLLPALALGAGTVIPLAAEMRGCRWSHSLILGAAGASLVAAGLDLEFDARYFSTATRQLLESAFLLTGHLGLFLSMWLHARHVLYFTADPASPARSRWRIPRPHFRLPRFAPSRNRAVAPDDAGTRPARRKISTSESPAEPSSGQPRERAARGPAVPTNDELAGKLQFHGENRHETTPAIPGTFPGTDDDSATESGGSDEPVSSGEESQEFPSKPDLRGLSKKQRRRLMQELRDRERASGR